MTEDAMKTAMAGMASSGNPRVPMDIAAVQTFVNQSAKGTSHGEMHPRFSQPANDPAFFPVARPAPQLQEKAGARHGIRVNIPTLNSPEAGATQANGRTIQGRGTGGSFWGGAAG